MNGLFTRLARQAVGQPRNPVRAAVSMARQSTTEAIPAQSGYPDSGLAAGINDYNQRSDLDGSPSSGRVAKPTLSPSTKSTNVAGSDKAASRASEAGMAAEPAPSESIDEPVAKQLAEPTSLGATDTQVSVTHEPADSQLPASVQSLEEILTDPVNEPPLAVESGFYEPPSPQESAPTGSAAPAPLMPSVASPAPMNSAAVTQMSTAASESANEVHVHIGRIEVTALQNDAAPKPKPRAARQPMSLDDYLARRRQN